MEQGNVPRALRDFRYYIIKSLKFFNLKDERLTPVLFTISLIVSFSSTLLPIDSSITSTSGIVYNIITFIIMYLTSSVYLIAYIKELKNEEYNLGICTKLVITKIHKVLIATIIYILVIAMGSILLIVPGIILYLMFIFSSCIILDSNESVINSFTLSKRITDGKKINIFSLILLFNFLLFVPISFVFLLALSSNSGLIFSFVISFVSAIVNIMQQRMIALMYIDLKYGVNRFVETEHKGNDPS